MKKLLLALALFLAPASAWAQCNGLFPPNTVCGNSLASPAPPKAIPGANTSGGIVVNILDFGGVADSMFDNLTAIHNAIASLPPEGGTVFFPAAPLDDNCYAISAQLVVGDGSAAAPSTIQNIHLVGAGGSGVGFQFSQAGPIHGTCIKYIGTTPISSIVKLAGPIIADLKNLTLISGYQTITHNVTANENSTTALASISSMTGVVVGAAVTGSNIPANTILTAVNVAGNSATMSAAATGTATGVTITVVYNASYSRYGLEALHVFRSNFENVNLLNATMGARIDAYPDAIGVATGASENTWTNVISENSIIAGGTTGSGAFDIGSTTFGTLDVNRSTFDNLVGVYAGDPNATGLVLRGADNLTFRGGLMFSNTPGLGDALAILPPYSSSSTTATTISGMNTLTAIGSMTNVVVGALVTGSGIPASTVITQISPSVLMSQNATASATITITVANLAAGLTLPAEDSFYGTPLVGKFFVDPNWNPGSNGGFGLSFYPLNSGDMLNPGDAGRGTLPDFPYFLGTDSRFVFFGLTQFRSWLQNQSAVDIPYDTASVFYRSNTLSQVTGTVASTDFATVPVAANSLLARTSKDYPVSSFPVLPANQFSWNRKIRLTMSGNYLNNAGAQTMSVSIYFGGTQLYSAVVSLAGSAFYGSWYFEGDLIELGSTSFLFDGRLTVGAAGTAGGVAAATTAYYGSNKDGISGDMTTDFSLVATVALTDTSMVFNCESVFAEVH